MVIDTSLQDMSVKLEFVFTEKIYSDPAYKNRIKSKSESQIFDVTEAVAEDWTIYGKSEVNKWQDNF